MPVTLNVYVKDKKTGAPIGNARVVGLTKNQIIDPPTRQTSGDGGANLYYQGPAFNPSVEVSLAVDAAGYAPGSTNDKPILFGSSDVNYTIELEPSFKVAPISKEQLRAMTLKGNFGGMVLPGWGLSTHDALFDPMTPWYPETTQQYIFQQKRDRGLNVINLCSWSDYHGNEFGMPVRYDWTGVNGELQARDYCVKLRKAGFLPFFHLLGDRWGTDQYDETGGQCGAALDLINRMVPALRDVVGALCLGYELRGCCGASGAPYSAAQYRHMLILVRQLAPETYLAAHFTSENSAGSSHSPVEVGDPWHGDEIDFWTETDWSDGSTLMDAIFYQAPTDAKLFDGNEWEDRWQEMIDRIGAGNVRWPSKCTAVDLLWGEAGWYNVTRGDNTEAQLITVSDRAMVMGGKWSFSG